MLIRFPKFSSCPKSPQAFTLKIDPVLKIFSKKKSVFGTRSPVKINVGCIYKNSSISNLQKKKLEIVNFHLESRFFRIEGVYKVQNSKVTILITAFSLQLPRSGRPLLAPVDNFNLHIFEKYFILLIKF